MVIFIGIHGSLGIQVNRPGKIDFIKIIIRFNNQGVVVGLSGQSSYFGMVFFAKDNDLGTNSLLFAKILLDAALQPEYNGTGAVDEFDVVFDCVPVDFRRFPVSPDQDPAIG